MWNAEDMQECIDLVCKGMIGACASVFFLLAMVSALLAFTAQPPAQNTHISQPAEAPSVDLADAGASMRVAS